MPLDKGKVIKVLKEDFATEFTFLIYLLLSIFVCNSHEKKWSHRFLTWIYEHIIELFSQCLYFIIFEKCSCCKSNKIHYILMDTSALLISDRWFTQLTTESSFLFKAFNCNSYNIKLLHIIRVFP